LSEGKATWPGRKQVWRAYDLQGRMCGDTLSLETDKYAGET
jgi:nicotinate phosphoribosyltransferase